MKLIYIFLALATLTFTLQANQEEKAKHNLQANYFINYNQLPPSANSISDIFGEGMIYGRLRAHWLFYDWEHTLKDSSGNRKTQDHNILGLGGSLIYKTAPYAGLSATVGMYYTSAGTGLDNQPSNVAFLKSGKDTISRNNASNGNGKSYAVVGQSYLQYEHARFKARIGREIFNSFFTKSNDSKMIPNTFEGITLESKDLTKTRLRAAYLTRQKLRDHDNFHSVIMYDDRADSSSEINFKWNSNDDSAAHRGLNHSNFQKYGIDENPGLFVIDGYTRAIFDKKLKISGSALYLENLFYTTMLEMNYKFDLGNGFSLSPGVRYVQQFDDGAGKVGGASLTGKAAQSTASSTIGLNQDIRNAYSNPDSVDAKMYAARMILSKDAASLSFGYTKVADEADFITPWRGFITSGYTRAMAQYNWFANTETWRIRFAYDFNKAKLIKGLRTYTSFARENFDSQKVASLANITNVYYFGLIQEINKQASFRFRSEFVDERQKSIPDHGEVRLELNYLF